MRPGVKIHTGPVLELRVARNRIDDLEAEVKRLEKRMEHVASKTTDDWAAAVLRRSIGG